jgi:hypothetical protein
MYGVRCLMYDVKYNSQIMEISNSSPLRLCVNRRHQFLDQHAFREAGMTGFLNINCILTLYIVHPGNSYLIFSYLLPGIVHLPIGLPGFAFI